MSIEMVQLSVKGKWYRVPALQVDGKSIVRRGKFLKIAFVKDEQWLETPVADPARCVDALKGEKLRDLRADIFTFASKLPSTEPEYPYPFELENVAAIRLNTFKEWWEGLPQETRKNVRRSQKRGVRVEVKSLDQKLLEDLVELNNDSPVRQGKVYTHFGKTLEQVTKDQEDFLDRSDYICAYHEEELVGVVKLVYRGNIAAILTFLPKASHADKRPANALMAKVVEICDQKKMLFITFGLFNYHNKKDTPLRDFKIRNGFEGIDVPRYYVALTLKGALGIKFNLYHGLMGVLPHSVITALVNARAKLYSLKLKLRAPAPSSGGQASHAGPPAESNS